MDRAGVFVKGGFLVVGYRHPEKSGVAKWVR